MEIQKTDDANSWFLQEGNTFKEPVAQSTTTDNKKTDLQESPTGEPVLDEDGNPIVKEEEKQEGDNTEEPSELAETLQELFGTLKSDKTNNFAFYENQEIKTPEDVIEFININADIRYQNQLRDIDKNWYESKSPVFQQFAQMAELAGDDHSKLYDLINTQKRIEDVTALDPKEVTDAQAIIQNYMLLKGEPKEVIAEELKDLTERGLISERAEKYKPVIVNHFEKEKQDKIETERQTLTKFYTAVEANEKNVITFLSAPEIGGMKMKNEDKDMIYSNLAFNPEIQGFGIFKKVEEVQSKGDFAKLAKVILLLENEERFDELYGTRIKTQTAKDLRKKITFANDSTEAGDIKPDKKPVKQDDNQFNPWARTT